MANQETTPPPPSLEPRVARLEQIAADTLTEMREMRTELVTLMNDQHERLLNRLNRIDRETATTHEYLLDIVRSHGVRLRDIEGRLDQREG